MDDSRLQEYTNAMTFTAFVLVIASFVAEMLTIASNAGSGVYFALGCVMMLTAIIFAATATAKYLRGSKGVVSATVAWAMTVIWAFNSASQFAYAVFLH